MSGHSFSIKYKILFLLVSLPTLMLAAYFALATNIFKSDKIAYVFDASSTVSKTLGAQTKAEIDSLLSRIKPLWTEFDWEKKDFRASAQRIFFEMESIKYISVFRQNEFNEVVKQREMGKFINKPINMDNLSLALINQARESGFALSRMGKDTSLVGLAYRIQGSRGFPVYITAISDAEDIIQSFDRPSSYSTFLVDPDGNSIAGPMFAGHTISTFGRWPFFKKLKAKSTPSLTLE
jgi:hypothetical protein